MIVIPSYCPNCGLGKPESWKPIAVTNSTGQQWLCGNCGNQWKALHMNDATKELLTERGKTHGLFADNARFSIHLFGIIEQTPNYKQLNYEQKEALRMICHKIARICSGNPNELDHWRDISGYSLLAMEACDVSAKRA